MDGEVDGVGSRDRRGPEREGQGKERGRKAKKERGMDGGNKVRQKGTAIGTCLCRGPGR